MLVFTKDRHGNHGHPTRRFDQIRKLLKQKRVKIIGGGASGKPIVVVFLFKKFDADKTIGRQFIRVIDPGYRNIGFAICEVKEKTLVVMQRGSMVTRIADIKGLMQERMMHRRHRRTIARYKMRRLSAQKGQVLTKFKAPRNIRSVDKTNATFQHGVNVHLNLYGKLHKIAPLPVYQTKHGIEDNCFDVRAMTWGRTNGKGYQESPRTTPIEKRCIACGTKDGIHFHHVIKRKQGGTDVPENKLPLCKSCHEDVHAGRLFIPIKGIKQNRALGSMNAITGALNRCKGILHIPASDTAVKRRELGIDKEHGNDAVCAAASLCGCTSVDKSQEVYLSLKKFRRHCRARIHAVRERNYTLDGKIIAQNRRKRMDQKTDSRAELLPLTQDIQQRLKVYPGVKLIKFLPKDAITVGGDSWVHLQSGKRFVATGVLSGNYLFSPELKGIVGKTYVRPSECKRLTRNEGVVII